MNPQNYTINIRPGWGISQVVKVSQGDVGRPLAFTIMDGQDAITLSSTATVTITGTKPSGLGFTQDCTLSGNTASIDTVATMTQEAGSVPAELIVTDGSTVIGTANFVMYVEPAAHPEGTTDGDAETARDLMTRAQAAVEQAEAEADRAEDAAESVSQTGISTAGATAGQVPTANGAGRWSWQDQQGGGGTSDDIENKSTVSGATVTDALSSLSDQIANLSGGAPTPAATVPDMVDTSKIYLYTGSESGYTAGHWYYYSDGAWTDGGVYGAVSSNVFSDYAKETLITILRSAMYTSDQSGNINKLEDALARQVVSIGATVDLGGNTIYTDDELDTLRQYLTVTATYDDMTTSPVTGYALSGTLVAGTSTITITYQGNSTTVSVPVSQAVVRYAVTYNLTGVTSSNTDATIAEGNTYTTTLTAETAGYIPTEVVVTMGGADVTATAYNASTHVVSIANVSGAISITAVEAEDPYAPKFELTSPLVVGDTTDPRINDTANNRIATGVTVNDDENWTVCVDFTSLLDGAIQDRSILRNGNNQFSVLYSPPNWNAAWHGSGSNIKNDYSGGKWKGLNFVAIITHESNTLSVNVYGTVTNTKTKTSIATASNGQVSIGNTHQMGTINRFAIYKRVLTTDEITAWIGE